MDLIAYRRVSTARQGASGLGLKAQDVAVAAYARAIGGTILRGSSSLWKLPRMVAWYFAT